MLPQQRNPLQPGRGWLAGDWPSMGGALNITAAAWTAGFHWWRSANITRCHRNVTDCKSAQYCTTRGHPHHYPKLHPGPCSSVDMRPWTDTDRQRDTDARDHNTFCIVYDSRKMQSPNGLILLHSLLTPQGQDIAPFMLSH